MTGPAGNGEFRLPETLNVPRGEAEGNIEVKVAKSRSTFRSLFPLGPVVKCLLEFFKVPLAHQSFFDQKKLLASLITSVKALSRLIKSLCVYRRLNM